MPNRIFGYRETQQRKFSTLQPSDGAKVTVNFRCELIIILLSRTFFELLLLRLPLIFTSCSFHGELQLINLNEERKTSEERRIFHQEWEKLEKLLVSRAKHLIFRDLSCCIREHRRYYAPLLANAMIYQVHFSKFNNFFLSLGGFARHFAGDFFVCALLDIFR